MMLAGNTIRISITPVHHTGLDVPYRRLLVYVDGREHLDCTIVGEGDGLPVVQVMYEGHPIVPHLIEPCSH